MVADGREVLGGSVRGGTGRDVGVDAGGGRGMGSAEAEMMERSAAS